MLPVCGACSIYLFVMGAVFLSGFATPGLTTVARSFYSLSFMEFGIGWTYTQWQQQHTCAPHLDSTF